MMPNTIISRARVVIVDDEASNVRLLERILEMFGCKAIFSTTDSREALKLCLEKNPDIVLLDLHMPHIDGFKLIEQLQDVTCEDEYLPILVLTADITVETKRRALSSGAKDLVTKPLDHSEVVLRIKNLLENRFLHQALHNQNEMLEEQVRLRTAEVESALAQLQSAQEKVVKQERLRALGMMAGGIAHDFNNALTMVLGYGELLLPYVQQNASPKEFGYLKNMVSAAQDATHVVSRLREFYRPASGTDIRVAVDVRSVIEQAVSVTSPKWSSKSLADGVHIQMTIEVDPVPTVSGNAAELREVLTNLIFNAVDAMPTGGSIAVSAKAAEGGVQITVRDSGVGMTEEERERCLEPFFTTKGDWGTGLGLSVVYGIIQRHEGKIEVQSEKNAGTAFSFWLPEGGLDAEPTPAELETMNRPLHVLVVDDQEIICELITEYLQADGHSTVTAAHGRDALDRFETESYDLVITDQSMPEMNGVQLAAALRGRAPQVPVILLTGFGEEMQALGDQPDNVDLVIGKPVSASELRRAICKALAARETSPVLNQGRPRCRPLNHLSERKVVLTRGVEPPRVAPHGSEPCASAIPPRERIPTKTCLGGQGAQMYAPTSKPQTKSALTDAHRHQHVQKRALNLNHARAHLIDQVQEDLFVVQIPQGCHQKLRIERDGQIPALVRHRQRLPGLTDIRRVRHDLDVVLREHQFHGVRLLAREERHAVDRVQKLFALNATRSFASPGITCR